MDGPVDEMPEMTPVQAGAGRREATLILCTKLGDT